MSQGEKEILVSTQGPVGVLTLNRPKALNALNRPLMEQLVRGLEAFEADPAVRCVIVAGSQKSFAAGADIREMSSLKDGSEARSSLNAHLARWDRVAHCAKPTVAAVSGYALGGGLELALACDMIVASETAVFGQPEILIGVIPGAGGTQRLTRAVGKAMAMEMILTGRKLGAREALDLGLVNRVVPTESFLEEALCFAKEAADAAPLAVKAAREAVLQALESGLDAGIAHERTLFYGLFSTLDQKEGMKAFVEKRKPSFQGK